MSDRECPYCGNLMDPYRDHTVLLQDLDEVDELEENYKQVEYHAGCFMDIVNSEDGVLKRTLIMEGEVARGEENGVEIPETHG